MLCKTYFETLLCTSLRISLYQKLVNVIFSLLASKITKIGKINHCSLFSNENKGYLISEGNFGVFKSPKKQTFFEVFLAYHARTEILQEKGSLFGRFEFTIHSEIS